MMYIVLLNNGNSFGRTDFIEKRDEVYDVLKQCETEGIEACAIDLELFFSELDSDFEQSFFTIMPRKEMHINSRRYPERHRFWFA